MRTHKTERKLALLLAVALPTMSCASWETAYEGPPSGVDLEGMVELCEADASKKYRRLQTARVRAKVGERFGPRRKICGLNPPAMEVPVAGGEMLPLSQVEEVVVELKSSPQENAERKGLNTAVTVVLIVLGTAAVLVATFFIVAIHTIQFPTAPIL